LASVPPSAKLCPPGSKPLVTPLHKSYAIDVTATACTTRRNSNAGIRPLPLIKASHAQSWQFCRRSKAWHAKKFWHHTSTALALEKRAEKYTSFVKTRRYHDCIWVQPFVLSFSWLFRAW